MTTPNSDRPQFAFGRIYSKPVTFGEEMWLVTYNLTLLSDYIPIIVTSVNQGSTMGSMVMYLISIRVTIYESTFSGAKIPFGR